MKRSEGGRSESCGTEERGRARERGRKEEKRDEGRKGRIMSTGEKGGCVGGRAGSERGGRSSGISAANDESNKTRMDGRLGQIGRPFNWEFDEFMDFLICHYGRPFRKSRRRLFYSDAERKKQSEGGRLLLLSRFSPRDC